RQRVAGGGDPTKLERILHRVHVLASGSDGTAGEVAGAVGGHVHVALEVVGRRGVPGDVVGGEVGEARVVDIHPRVGVSEVALGAVAAHDGVAANASARQVERSAVDTVGGVLLDAPVVELDGRVRNGGDAARDVDADFGILNQSLVHGEGGR